MVRLFPLPETARFMISDVLILSTSLPPRAQMVQKQAGDWTVLHCAHRATTVLSWGLCEHEGWSSYPLHFFAHLFPPLCHLRFPRRLALGWFGHHHGVKAPL